MTLRLTAVAILLTAWVAFILTLASAVQPRYTVEPTEFITQDGFTVTDTETGKTFSVVEL